MGWRSTETTGSNIRVPAVAGLFYPGGAAELAQTVDDALASVPTGFDPPKAIIAPHAGYIYSGPIAASVYAQLAPVRDTINRVLLLGPCHRVPVTGLAASSADAFATPLGDVPVDRPAVDGLLDLPFVNILDAAHTDEHALEVHLPFLQRALSAFSVVPLVVGRASPEQVDEVLRRLWGGPETLVVISSDLSHYHPYDRARALDRQASTAIERLRGDALEDEHACGRYPIRGLLERARALDLRATTLDLRNSGDTAGTRDRVVGYGAYSFEYAANARLPEPHRDRLVAVARQAIVDGTRMGDLAEVPTVGVPAALMAARATFVTIKSNGQLRGCIGSVGPERALIEDVAHNAYRAATGDPRFPPVDAAEAERLDVGVSILSTPRPMTFRDEPDLIDQLQPNIDGIILSAGRKRGLFLPQVWSSLPDPRTFLRHLKTKAGLKADYWSQKVQVHRFSVESF